MSLPLPTPSAHALELAGVDLVDRAPPLLRILAARETVVVLSRSRDPRREVRLKQCQRDAVPVVVRPSGGGAVVLAPGVLTASILNASLPGTLFPEPSFHRYCTAVAAALNRLGAVAVGVRGISDLCLGDRKVAGSSLRLFADRVLFQVSVLVDVDLSLIDRYLLYPSRAPAYRRERSHGEFLTTLRRAGVTAPTQAVADALEHALASELGGDP